ncbi:MAG: hypothetical protein Q4D55_01380 [Eubacteriales bacterium]|nr:hypothetical protein [Eubacteriales bacterium]
MEQDWKSNPKLAGMNKEKLDLLSSLASQGIGKSPSELLPFLMGAASQGKQKGLKFNKEEIDTIIQVLKMGKSPQEAEKLDRVVSLMKMIR